MRSQEPEIVQSEVVQDKIEQTNKLEDKKGLGCSKIVQLHHAMILKFSQHKT